MINDNDHNIFYKIDPQITIKSNVFCRLDPILSKFVILGIPISDTMIDNPAYATKCKQESLPLLNCPITIAVYIW